MVSIIQQAKRATLDYLTWVKTHIRHAIGAKHVHVEIATSKSSGHSDTSMLTKTHVHEIVEIGHKRADYWDELVAKTILIAP